MLPLAGGVNAHLLKLSGSLGLSGFRSEGSGLARPESCEEGQKESLELFHMVSLGFIGPDDTGQSASGGDPLV